VNLSINGVNRQVSVAERNEHIPVADQSEHASGKSNLAAFNLNGACLHISQAVCKMGRQDSEIDAVIERHIARVHVNRIIFGAERELALILGKRPLHSSPIPDKKILN